MAQTSSPQESGEDSSEKVISLYQKRIKIYPRAVEGTFMTWRWALVWLTQIVFYGLPWLTWNDRQAVLFDLGTRRFYLFGVVLYPQDFIYLTGLLIVSAYALFLFTAVAGRLWCGYACPQTVYTEIFLWFERKIEGDRVARMRLDQGPWNANKVWRKTAKQVVWISFALWTGFTFVGYFTPIKQLAHEAVTLGFGPWELFWVFFYAFATWGNAGFLREQVCKYMCPYARFQSAMFDKDTLVISYDTERGDPRGSRSKKADPKAQGLGDCIDCGLCVQVCPTGIDIRNGLQYECIGCAACVDVCDGVMEKMNYPKGLVRYATQNSMKEHLKPKDIVRRIFRPRVMIYTAILVAMVVGMGASLVMRSPVRVDVVRDRSSLARIVEDGVVENVYRLQVMNATESAQRYKVTASGLEGIKVSMKEAQVELQSTEARWVVVSLQIPPQVAMKLQDQQPDAVQKVHIKVEQITGEQAGASVEEKTTFLLPK